MHGSKGEPKDGDDTERDPNTHKDTEEASDGEIESDVNGIEFAQHDNGVEEHDDVAVIAVDHLPENVENCFRVCFTKTFFSVGDSNEVIRTEIEDSLDELIFPIKQQFILCISIVIGFLQCTE